ncbi:hypothetical protein ACFQ61_21930 [Streptomyces sp. NPDC056500]|uniref:hypothetical protein n=1 Tax=Streptomyces sp. NPDC056500 TaxID=3345840 RepID=UPI00368A8947
MTVPHAVDDGDAPIHQIVFRWAGNRSGAGAGISAVAQSCGERDAREMAEQLGPILRVRGGDQRSIVRVIWNDRAVLVRRRPKADAQGRGSTVCHALISPTRLLTASFCLGLGASPWGDDTWTQASGTLNPIPYDRLDAMANHAIPRLDEAVFSLIGPLESLVAQLLRTPSGRISALTRGLDGAGTVGSDQAPDPALVALRGLCEVFGATLGGEGWTYASYATVDSHPLRITFVPSWRASHEEDVRLRRIDLTEQGSDRAAELARELVRHYLDHIGAGGVAADGAREKYERPLERLRGALAEIEDDEERYEAVDRALRGLPPRDRTVRPQRGTDRHTTAGAHGEGRTGGPSGRSTGAARRDGHPGYDDEQGYERGGGSHPGSWTHSVPSRSGSTGGQLPGSGPRADEGRPAAGYAGTHFGTGGRPVTGTEPATGSNRSSTGTGGHRGLPVQVDGSGAVESPQTGIESGGAAVGGSTSNRLDGAASGTFAIGSAVGGRDVGGQHVGGHDAGRASTTGSGSMAVPEPEPDPGSAGWNSDALVHGSSSARSPSTGQQWDAGADGGFFAKGSVRDAPDASSGAAIPYPPGQDASRQYASDAPSVAAALPAPPSGFDLAVGADPVGATEHAEASIPPRPTSPPPQSGPQPSHQNQMFHVKPEELLGFSSPFPRTAKWVGKRKPRQVLTAPQRRQLHQDLSYATAGDHEGGDLKVKVLQDLERCSDEDLLAVIAEHGLLSYQAQNMVLRKLAEMSRTEDESETLCGLLLDRRFLLEAPPPDDESLWTLHGQRVIKVACWLFRSLQKPLAGDAVAERVGRFLRQLAASRDWLPTEFLDTLLLYCPSDEVPILHNLVWRELALGLNERPSGTSNGGSVTG